MPARILIIDNFDSFTFNLYHYVQQYNEEVKVIRYNSKIGEQAEKHDAIIISPGPGLPSDYPQLFDLIKNFSNKPILGICLGMQAIALTYGAKLTNLREVNHGISRLTFKTKCKEPFFENIPDKFYTGRYHSWIVNEKSLPGELLVTARDEKNNIMALKHISNNIKGVQFHPESVLTPYGKTMIQNWVYSLEL